MNTDSYLLRLQVRAKVGVEFLHDGDGLAGHGVSAEEYYGPEVVHPHQIQVIHDETTFPLQQPAVLLCVHISEEPFKAPTKWRPAHGVVCC